jgi:DNA-binding IclR family transcriptional regulator
MGQRRLVPSTLLTRPGPRGSVRSILLAPPEEGHHAIAEHRTPTESTTETSSILSKAFEVMRAFNTQQRVLTLSELSRATDLPKSTVHRLLTRLVELDAVEHHRGYYKLSLGLFELSANTPAGSMRDIALPYMASLHRWTGGVVQFAVLRGLEVVYLESLSREHFTSTLSRVGGRLPASCTAIGKAMLAWQDLVWLRASLPTELPRLTTDSIADPDSLVAELREVKRSGVAQERGEAQTGLFCIAAPIVMSGFEVGAISIGHSDDGIFDQSYLTGLRSTVAQVSREADHLHLDSRRHRWFPYEVPLFVGEPG